MGLLFCLISATKIEPFCLPCKHFVKNFSKIFHYFFVSITENILWARFREHAVKFLRQPVPMRHRFACVPYKHICGIDVIFMILRACCAQIVSVADCPTFDCVRLYALKKGLFAYIINNGAHASRTHPVTKQFKNYNKLITPILLKSFERTTRTTRPTHRWRRCPCSASMFPIVFSSVRPPEP